MKFINQILFSLTFLVLLSCENEPVDVFTEVSSADLISGDSNLYFLLNKVVSDDQATSDITCIDFVYSFIVVIYDENLEILSSQTVSNDSEFYNMLQSTADDQFINVSFPITSSLQDGSTFEINNKNELEQSIADCKAEEEEQLLTECTNLLTDCVWEVALPDTDNINTYVDSVFRNNSDGPTTYFYRGEIYNGTWIVYFIEDELHININLQGEDDVQMDWNFDWKTEILGANTMQIVSSDDREFILSKECQEDNYCTTLDFEECVQDGQADISLSGYEECVIIISAPQQTIDTETGEISPLINWDITYHLTASDAESGINALEDNFVLYESAGVQTIYARIENPETLDYTVTILALIPQQCN